MASFDAKKLSRIDWVIVAAAGITFIALFLPWYGVSAGGFNASVSGWNTSYGWLGALLIVAAGVYLVLERADVKLPSRPIGPAVTILGAAVIGTVIVALRWLTLPKGQAGLNGVSLYSYGPRVGIYIALIAGIAEAFCAVRLFRASSEVLPWKTKASAEGSGSVPDDRAEQGTS